MTQIVKHRKNFKLNTSHYKAIKPISSYSKDKPIKSVVLSYLVRNFSLVNYNREIRKPSDTQLKIIASNTEVSISLIRKVVREFIDGVIYYNKLLRNCKTKYNPKNRNRKTRAYLHKLYRLAPVFDYKRARKNLEILQFHLAQRGTWLKISSQLAIVIYVTDKNEVNSGDKNIIQKNIIQKNILTISCCSAFAFHRARNELRIK